MQTKATNNNNNNNNNETTPCNNNKTQVQKKKIVRKRPNAPRHKPKASLNDSSKSMEAVTKFIEETETKGGKNHKQGLSLASVQEETQKRESK